MNFVRNLVSQRKSSNTNNSQLEDQALAINHLCKLFQDFKKAPKQSQDVLLYNILPLFCKIFAQIPPGEMVDRFPDLPNFCTQVSHLMVREIKSRATNQSTEEASRVIAEFLQPTINDYNKDNNSPTTEEDGRGWLILSALRLISLGPTSLVECMIAASLPSTMAKCLYILFDLPEPTNDSASNPILDSSNARHLLHNLFKHLMTRMCMSPRAAEELSQKEDLTLLFGAMASWCPSYNKVWRKTSADILLTIAQNALNTSIIQKIHNQNCFQKSLKNVQKSGLSPSAVVDVFTTLFCFIRESTLSSQSLFDDFRACDGYTILPEFMLKFEVDEHPEAKEALKTLSQLVGKLTTCGLIELKPKPQIADQLFTIQGFQIPSPKGRYDSVRNIPAFHVLQSVFLRSQTAYLSNHILDVIKNIYCQDPANYFILDAQNTIANLSEKIHLKSLEVQKSFFDILYTIVVSLRYVPMKEISSLTILIKTCNCAASLILCFKTLLDIVRAYPIFKSVYHDLGVLELIVNQLHLYVHAIQDSQPKEEQEGSVPQSIFQNDQAELGSLVLEFLRVLLTGSADNVRVFRNCGGSSCLLQLVDYPCSRDLALSVLQQLTLTGAEEDDMSALLALVCTTSGPQTMEIKIMVLKCLCTILRESHRCRAVFRRVGGFVYIVQELGRLEGSLNGTVRIGAASETDSVHETQIIAFIKAIFATLTIAMKLEPGNVRYFNNEIRFDCLVRALRSLGCFGPPPNKSKPQDATKSSSNNNPHQEAINNNFEIIAPDTTATSPTEDTSGSLPYVNLQPGHPSYINRDLSWQLGERSLKRPGVGKFMAYFFSLDNRDALPSWQTNACVVARCLYEMAIEAFDKPHARKKCQPSNSKLSNADRPQSIAEGGSPSLDSNSKSGGSRVSDNLKRQSHHGDVSGGFSLESRLSESVAATSTSYSHQPVAFQFGDLGPVCIPLQNALDLSGSPSVGGSWSHQICDPRDLTIVHAGATLGLLHLTATINWVHNPEDTIDFQICLLNVLKSLLKSERNQQIMCDVGMPHDLLTLFHSAMTTEEHQLHAYVQRLFEKLSAQSLTPKDLRRFLRLSEPLCCKPVVLPSQLPEECSEGLLAHHGGPLAMSRVTCLVSMTTPRDPRLVLVSEEYDVNADSQPHTQWTSALVQTSASQRPAPLIPPPFVEFDMSLEGFGCLLLPSIAPQASSGSSMVNVGLVTTMDHIAASGIGTTERVFPPPSGFSFSTWICIDRYCLARKPHPIRLLTIIRSPQGSQEEWVCLAIYIRPTDRTIVVTTQERLLQAYAEKGGQEEDRRENESTVSFMSPEVAIEGRWRHLVFVFTKAGILKNSSCSLYVNASLVASRKISYIAANLTPSAVNSNVAAVSAIIGTPPCLHRISNTKWRQGPAHLLEEPLQPSSLSMLHQLGPNYVGSFQAPINVFDEPVPTLCPEEKVVFGVYGVSCSIITVARIKKLYNHLDAKIIARQLYLSTKENTTPIRLLLNSAFHLVGSARSIGAVMIGYQGVRSFSPRPIARVLECIGGTAVLLGLVAMASDAEGLYAAVKALCGAVKNNPIALRQMNAHRGYQMLGMLLKRKRHLLNNQILYLIFSLVGSLDCLRDRREVAPNWSAFEDLLIDIEIWRETDNDLLRSLLEHFYELIVKSPVGPLSPAASNTTSSTSSSNNPSSQNNPSLSHSNSLNSSLDHRMVLLEKGLISKLICLLMKSALLPNTMETLKSLLQLLLMNIPRSDDLRKFGQFMVWTLPPKCINESNLNLEEFNYGTLPKQHSFDSEAGPSCSDSKHTNLRRLLRLRNFCFDIFLHVLTNPHPVNLRVCEEIQKCLGFDWLMLFLQSHLHKSCIVHALHTLVVVISPPTCLLRFRDGVMCSGWLKGSEAVLQRRHGIMLMQETSLEASISGLRDLNSDACHLPGFLVLQRLLSTQFCNPEAYFLMTALLLGNRVSQVPSCLSDNLPHSWMESVEFELDSLYNMLFREGSTSDNKGNSITNNSSNKKSAFRHLDFCFEAATVLLVMVRNFVSSLACHHSITTSGDTSSSPVEETEHTCPTFGPPNPCKDYPLAILQFFVYLYQSNTEFCSMTMSSEFLLTLASVLFPKKSISKSSSDCSLDGSTEDSVFKKSKSAEYEPQTATNEKVKTLITHPVRKFVFDFFKMIITDNFSLPPTNRSLPLVDILLECRIEYSTAAQQREFQTCLLRSLADHFLAVDILCSTNLPLPPGGNVNHLANNVLYFATRLVDKLFQGGYQGKTKDVVYFINRLLIQSKKRNLSLEPLYRCLNRLVLFQLSQPIVTISDQGELVSFMQKMISVGAPSPSTIHLERGLLTPQNIDPSFVPCLVHCLFQLGTGRKVNSLSVSNLAGSARSSVDGGEDLATEEGSKSISRAASKVWEVVYVLRRQALEDLVKQPLPPSGNSSVPYLTSVIPVLNEACQKIWLQHQEFEQSGGSIGPNAAATWGRVSGFGSSRSRGVGSSIQDKISRMSSGMFGLAASAPSSSSSSVSSNQNIERSGSLKSGKRDPISSSAREVLTFPEAEKWTEPHINVIKELVEFHYRQYVNKEQFMRRYLESEWQAIEQDLTRERGLWGPNVASPLDKWTLDSTEGPCRMRKRLLKNDLFYQDYPYRQTDYLQSENSHRYKIAICKDSLLYYLTYRPTTLLADDKVTLSMPDSNETQQLNELIPDTVNKSLEEISVERAQTLLQGSCSLHAEHSESQPAHNENSEISQTKESSLALPTEVVDEEDSEEFTELQVTEDILEPGEVVGGSGNCGGCSGPSLMANNNNSNTPGADDMSHQDSHASILQLLEPGERISYMYRCGRILGLDVYEGLLLFGREHVYVIDGFTLIKTREIVDIDTLPTSVHDPIVPKSGSTCPASRSKKMYFKVANEDIREVHKRRYLLQPIAIEVFNADGRNFLLVFPKKMQHKVYSKFLQVAPLLTDNALESVSGQKQNVKMESASSGLLSNLIGEKSVTQRWERGEISNFQYLMYLNTLAGRSYNDLMQYPVFPWIVADYDSPELDLNNPATFRDLAKPMGAQSPDRLKQFERRFAEWEDPTGETPPYHYGTHYSSAMIVASYLVRIEPFSQHFLKLQGGHFDLADRMFHSIRDAWYSAAKHNMADVKELIPEFFYLPDFLLNQNNFDLGCKQNGVELNSVLLPTWAKGDAREFIRAHREALESDYVSAHLHEWIDLIFGFKQRDETAVEAINVFHHLFYEGNVDIYSIEDPLRRSAVIGYINNFGQIPKQLFRKPHPAKKIALPKSIDPLSANASKSLFYHHVDSLKPGMQPVKELKSPVGHIFQLDPSNKQVLAVEQNKCFILPQCNRCLSWGYVDGSLRICNYESERAVRVFEMLDYDQIICCIVPCDNLIVTAGISTVVRVWQLRNASSQLNRAGNHRGLSLRASLYGHTEGITCLAGSASWNLLVSGSRDRSCIIWDLSRLTFLRQLSGHAAPVACLCINEATGDIASCAGSWLYLWSLNGEPIVKVNTATTGRTKQILTVAMSSMMDWDSNNVILTGGSDGVVRMWSLEYIQAPVVKEKSTPSGSVLKEEPLNEDTKKVEDFHIGEDDIIQDEDDLVEPEEDEEEDEDNDEEREFQTASFTQPEFDDNDDDGVTKNDEVDVGDDALKTNPASFEKSQHSQAIDDQEYVIISQKDLDSVKMETAALQDSASMKMSSQNAPHLSLRRRSSLPLVTDKILSNEKNFSMSGSPALGKRNSCYSSSHVLREGFRWERQLIFRSKLTMHTAYERLDNRQPSAVTALFISRDHRTVYVGDARGRVFSWSVPVEPGRAMADHWVKDEGVEVCAGCPTRFSLYERRHHCRNCGRVFCAKCSRYEIEIYRLRLFKPVRVCCHCYPSLRQEQSSKVDSTLSMMDSESGPSSLLSHK